MTIQSTSGPQHQDQPHDRHPDRRPGQHPGQHPGQRQGVRRETGRRELTEARRARDIISLLHQRGELRGVHPMADLIDDAVRWTA